MAYQLETALTLPTSESAGAAIDVSELAHKTVFVKGTFTATYQIQIADSDKTNWINLGAPLTAQGVLEITADAAYIRANCTAYTSGSPTGSVRGTYSTRGG